MKKYQWAGPSKTTDESGSSWAYLPVINNMPYVNLPEVTIKAEKPPFYKKYPYYNNLSKTEQKILTDNSPEGKQLRNSPIGRQIGIKARTGEGITAKGTEGIIGLLVGKEGRDVSTRINRTLQGLFVEGVEAARGKPYNYSNALPNLDKKVSPQRAPTDVWIDKEKHPYLGLAADIFIDPAWVVPSNSNMFLKLGKFGRGLGTTRSLEKASAMANTTRVFDKAAFNRYIDEAEELENRLWFSKYPKDNVLNVAFNPFYRGAKKADFKNMIMQRNKLHDSHYKATDGFTKLKQLRETGSLYLGTKLPTVFNNNQNTNQTYSTYTPTDLNFVPDFEKSIIIPNLNNNLNTNSSKNRNHNSNRNNITPVTLDTIPVLNIPITNNQQIITDTIKPKLDTIAPKLGTILYQSTEKRSGFDMTKEDEATYNRQLLEIIEKRKKREQKQKYGGIFINN